jgi:prepilin peptidase CpaA
MNLETAVVGGARIAMIIGLIWAVASDLRYRIIPNVATLLVAAGGLFVLIVTSSGSAWANILMAAFVFVALLPFAWQDSMGAGDVKLIAAATLSEPLRGVVPLLLDIAVAGGMLACAYLFGGVIIRGHRRLRGAGGSQAKQVQTKLVQTVFGRFLQRGHTRRPLRATIPYAAAVLGGMMWRMMSGLG